MLTGIRENENTWSLPEQPQRLQGRDLEIFTKWAKETGFQAHKMSLEGGVRPNELLQEIKSMMRRYTNGGTSASRFFEIVGAARLKGYQLRYIYFVDPSCRSLLTVPEIPFDKIKEVGASMYRGVPANEKGSPQSNGGNGGALPTRSLLLSETN